MYLQAINHEIERHCEREINFLSYIQCENSRFSIQNMAMNRPYMERILMIFASLKNW